MTDSPLLTAALAYAARGWPVFPCRAADSNELDQDGEPKYRAKRPLIRKWQDGGSSADPVQIRRWWKRWPDALIGLPMGGAAGIFAVDFDPREEVDEETGEILHEYTLAELKADVEAQIGCELPTTVAQMTPSRGVHIFFRQPADGGAAIRNRGVLPDHVDVRGDGGYVIVAPSVISSNGAGATGPYRWLRGDLLADDVPVADAPPALIAALRAGKEISQSANNGKGLPANPGARGISPLLDASDAVRKYALSALDAEARELATSGRGGRNQRLNDAALKMGSLVAAGALSAAVVRAALLEAAESCGLVAEDGRAACEATFDSGFKAGFLNPRDLSAIAAAAANRASRRAQPSHGQRSAARGGRATASGPEAPAASSSGSAGASPRAPAPPFSAGNSKPSHMGGDEPLTAAQWGAGWVYLMRGLARAIARLQRGMFRPLTDLGNAERWHIHHGRDFRYSEALGWLGWDGRRWKREGGDPRSYPPMLGKSAMATVRAIQLEAAYIAGTGCPDFNAAGEAGVLFNPDGLDTVIKWVGPKDEKVPILRSQHHAQFGRQCEASGRIGAIAALARLQPGVSVLADQFDRAPMLFNVANGTLEFHRPADGQPARVELRPHRRSDLLTKVSPAFYRTDATCPLYDAFFWRAQPDEPMRRFLHAWAGYSLTGATGEQCFIILHGTQGGNGKSTWEGIRAYLMGDYAQKVKVETFLDGNFDQSGAQASPDIARLPGARMVYTAEPKQGKRFAEDLIKVVTGSEVITARHLNRDFFDFLPEFKISVACNRPPEASDDPAFWRRVRLTPWNVSVPEPERDKELPEKLQAEADGILNYFIAGALDWLTDGLPVPEAVTAATRKYQDASDVLGRFLRDATEPDAECRVQSSHLYEVYRAWCAFVQEKEWTQTGFSKKLLAKGIDKSQSSNVYWLGVRPKLEAEAFASPMIDAVGERVGWRRRDEVDEAALADRDQYLTPAARTASTAAPTAAEPLPTTAAAPVQGVRREGPEYDDW